MNGRRQLFGVLASPAASLDSAVSVSWAVSQGMNRQNRRPWLNRYGPIEFLDTYGGLDRRDGQDESAHCDVSAGFDAGTPVAPGKGWVV